MQISTKLFNIIITARQVIRYMYVMMCMYMWLKGKILLFAVHIQLLLYLFAKQTEMAPKE